MYLKKRCVFLLGDNIRKYRKINNMSQDELAEKLEVTRQSISLWETGQTQPSLDSIIALSKLFNVSTDELLKEDEAKPSFSNLSGSGQMNGKQPKRKKPLLLLVIGLILIIALLITVIVIIGNNSNSNDPDISSNTESISSYISSNVSEEVTSQPTSSKTSSKIEQSVVTSGKKTSTSETPKTDTKKDLFGYLKNFVIQNGTINGDYCYYSKPADNYGGYASEDFSLYYWGDTDKIEFCLHSVLDETFSINFYIYVPKSHTGNYEYITSYYYRDTGESLYEARGTIEAASFTKNYPLNCKKYIGSTDNQNDFMEMSRQGICDLIDCLEQFISVEDLDYSFKDFGFKNFN